MKYENNQSRFYLKEKYFTWLCAALIFLTSCTTKIDANTETLRISDIQGCGHISPYNNKAVTGIVGVVTNKFRTGFTIQSLIPDDRECSSEAIFVFTGTYPNVFPGQVVSVEGTIQEFFAGDEEDHNLSRTEIHDPLIEVLPERKNVPSYISIHNEKSTTPDRYIDRTKEFNIETDGLDYYESLEFMLVGVDSGIVVGPKNSYNEFMVLPDKMISNNLISKNGNLLLHDGDENPEIIMVDVASSFTQRVNVGDQFTKPIIGIMDYSFGYYKIWTLNDPEIKSVVHTLEKISLDHEETLSVLSYNIENYSLYDDAKKIRGIGCQIAKDLESPDILVLHEVLDDSGTADDNTVTSQRTLEQLVGEIKQCGGAEYLYSDNPPENNHDGGIEGGNIRSVVLYRTDQGLTLDIPDRNARGLTIKNGAVVIGENPYRFARSDNAFWSTRKPAAWLFTWRNEKVLIVGVHLVSQAATTPLWGNIQPPEKPEELKRVQQASLIRESIEVFSELSDDLRIIVAGDLNDYPWSDTFSEITKTNLINPSTLEPNSERFSYIFNGNSFQIDYILVDQMLHRRVVNYKIIHLNTPYSQELRFSDHDPVFFEFAHE
jgi:predicted extracellular nuclease